jgi:hypothetical protein
MQKGLVSITRRKLRHRRRHSQRKCTYCRNDATLLEYAALNRSSGDGTVAHFQKSSRNPDARFDTSEGRLVLMLEERTHIELAGGGPQDQDLTVDTVEPAIAQVNRNTVHASGTATTFELQGLLSGNTTLEARLLLQTPNSEFARRALWLAAPCWARLTISVLGADYRQSGGRWGNLVYGSTNPLWKNVRWTTMGKSGCGPTSLAMIMDYLIRLDTFQNEPMSFQGTDPTDTMQYTSKYGRAADSHGLPSGTSGPTMVNNIGRFWPGYAGRKISLVDDAITLLRSGKPLLLLCHGCTAYKLIGGREVAKTFPGHFMVLLGVEHDNRTFWLADPSLARNKYISREQLKKTEMWHIYKTS